MVQLPEREWPTSLDVTALMADGWTPLPFREFVVKVHSRCDLSCDYCYMYEMADQSWRAQPRVMSAEITELTAQRIGEHARSHRLPRVSLILHGGEPLLAGQELISRLVRATRSAAGDSVTVDVSVQTNGVGLSDSYLRLFSELGVLVGVSVDGDAGAHNRHRRFASGRGSHAAVQAALGRLRQFPDIFGGLLCVIDLRNDPIVTYEALAEFEPPRIDLLLPHGTWAKPPPGRLPGGTETPYADWLIPKPRTGIRLFEEIIQLLLGGVSETEMVGLAPVQAIVIETDGSIEQVDTLKVAFAGAPATELHLSHAALDDALTLPQIAARQIGTRALSATCRSCSIRRACGGGMYAHRYKEGTGFANPSVYCPDLFALIGHIRARLDADIRHQLRGRPSG
jgi:uncharacterized protein